MERNLIINEYQQLRVFLNKANKQANQKTEILFEIEVVNGSKYRLYATLKGEQNMQKLGTSRIYKL